MLLKYRNKPHDFEKKNKHRFVSLKDEITKQQFEWFHKYLYSNSSFKLQKWGNLCNMIIMIANFFSMITMN